MCDCALCGLFSPLQGLILEINELRYRISEMENERLQYEKKLKSTKVSLMIDIYLNQGGKKSRNFSDLGFFPRFHCFILFPTLSSNTVVP